ncbi:SelT/SelW/SelH family protein [Halobacterium zhouii]|uniref:SelT/SelW/SelH family protein n=1 Tax=Halobacterium zhouii TaxID=2902624 RepID=UPI001E629465|nr:Rdx family protein [Halobacterium zhouii]
MTHVTIEYCVPCGLLSNAVETQRTLLETHGQRLDGVTLDTGDGGVFEVRVDGATVYDKSEEGYDRDAIVERVGDRLD